MSPIAVLLILFLVNTIFRCPLYLEPDIFLHLLLVPDERIPADDGSTENV